MDNVILRTTTVCKDILINKLFTLINLINYLLSKLFILQ